MRVNLIQGDCLDALRGLEAESVDAVVTDPPAGISFMGKSWDSNRGSRNQWIAWLTEVMEEVHRVLKPGAHGLVWALPRTSHWTGMALEDAGVIKRQHQRRTKRGRFSSCLCYVISFALFAVRHPGGSGPRRERRPLTKRYVSTPQTPTREEARERRWDGYEWLREGEPNQ